GLTVGKGIYTISQIRNFLYSFVTVPTNKLENYRPNHATVQRAATMTGGYYWGAPPVNGVCKNIQELLPQTAGRTGHFVGPAELGFAFSRGVNGQPIGFDFSSFDV